MKEVTYMYNERFIVSEYLIKWQFTSGYFNYSTSKRPDISLYMHNNKRERERESVRVCVCVCVRACMRACVCRNLTLPSSTCTEEDTILKLSTIILDNIGMLKVTM